MEPESLAIIISLLSFAVAIFSVLYARVQANAAKAAYRDDHEYRRRQFAARIMTDWDSGSLSRSVVLARWPQRFNGPDPIPWTEIIAEREKQLRHLNELQIEGTNNSVSPNHLLITDHMAKILNYFELVAHVVNNKVADEKMIEDYLRNPLFNWYNVLKEFRENMTRQRKYDPWEPLDDLYERWYTKEKKEKQEQRIREKTGIK